MITKELNKTKFTKVFDQTEYIAFLDKDGEAEVRKFILGRYFGCCTFASPYAAFHGEGFATTGAFTQSEKEYAGKMALMVFCEKTT